MYPVHVSSSFLLTPTLSATLYLLLLRFFHRQYAQVSDLSAAIATDAPLSDEEAQVWALSVTVPDFGIFNSLIWTSTY